MFFRFLQKNYRKISSYFSKLKDFQTCTKIWQPRSPHVLVKWTGTKGRERGRKRREEIWKCFLHSVSDAIIQMNWFSVLSGTQNILCFWYKHSVFCILSSLTVYHETSNFLWPQNLPTKTLSFSFQLNPSCQYWQKIKTNIVWRSIYHQSKINNYLSEMK